MLKIRLIAFDFRLVGIFLIHPLKDKSSMVYTNKHLAIEIIQNDLDETQKCTVMMILPYELSSDKKFRKLPS